jgi:hypothetical protein
MGAGDVEVFCTGVKRELGPVREMLLASGIRSVLHKNEPLGGPFGRGGRRLLRKHFLTVAAEDARRAEILVDQFLRSDPFKKKE